MRGVELVLAGVFGLLGLRSLLRWRRRSFHSSSTAEQFVYLLYAGSRVGMWFALAGFFLGYALVDEPQGLRWYYVLLLALPAVHLLAGLHLWWRSGEAERSASRAGAEDREGRPATADRAPTDD